MNTQAAAIIKLTIILSIFVYATSAANYTVGGESGWSLDSDMESWSASKTFKIGDTLEFVYDPNIHSVLEVEEFDYYACDVDHVWSGVNKTLTLDRNYTRYFICGTPDHCQLGLKVEIVVNSDGRLPIPRPSTAAAKSPYKFMITFAFSLVSIILMIVNY